MTFTIIRSWAKSFGYKATKNNNCGYNWELVENTSINGTSKSVSKLAKDIFNHITSNKFVEYQNNYMKD